MGDRMRIAWQISVVIGLATLLLIFSFCDVFKTEPTANGSNLPDPVDPGPMGTIDSSSFNILFIGNSLTYYNSQPQLFWNMATASGKKLFVDQATIPGAQLQDHLKSDFTREKIKSQKWHLVILQEANDAIAFVEKHGEIENCLLQIKTMILENCSETKIAYFLPWSLPLGYQKGAESYNFETFQTMLRDGTVAMCQKIDMITAPVGWAWYRVITQRPDLQLYDRDGSHPSFLGSYLGACVYYVMVFQASVVDNKYPVLINKYFANTLQEIATKTVLDSLDYWNIRPLTPRRQ